MVANHWANTSRIRLHRHWAPPSEPLRPGVACPRRLNQRRKQRCHWVSSCCKCSMLVGIVKSHRTRGHRLCEVHGSACSQDEAAVLNAGKARKADTIQRYRSICLKLAAICLSPCGALICCRRTKGGNQFSIMQGLNCSDEQPARTIYASSVQMFPGFLCRIL